MKNQCHGQRKSLTVQLNSRRVRRIELYTKVCTDMLLLSEESLVDILNYVISNASIATSWISLKRSLLCNFQTSGSLWNEKLYKTSLNCNFFLYKVHWIYISLQEDQTIRTFAIYQKFLTLKFVLWAMEIFIFSSIQPISVKISGKYIYRKI